MKSKPDKGLGRVAQAEDFTCSKEERCERASLVGRTVIAHQIIIMVPLMLIHLLMLPLVLVLA